MADFQPSEAERVLLASGSHIVEIVHGLARVVACSEVPEEQAVAPTVQLAGRKSITIAEARTLGLIP